jgi:hypothetical protein
MTGTALPAEMPDRDYATERPSCLGDSGFTQAFDDAF